MEKQLKDKRDEILKAKKQKDGNDPVALTRKIRNLDQKLEKLRQKHNEALAYNVQLRDDINMLRNEKNIFEEIHANLKKELKDKNKDYSEIVLKAKKALRDIDLAKEKLALAKTASYKEQKNLEKEYQSIYKLLDEENRDEKLKDIRDKMRKENDFKRSHVSSSQIKKEVFFLVKNQFFYEFFLNK